ncbi:MAG: DUF1475 family protein [Verrucomicrobia bacterium]|nr:DUF1475 family protein [Verrucomicrobiota bacterium]
MILGLRLFFSVVLVSMLAVTSWASSHVALWEIPQAVLGHPWFIATLFDAYFGFLTFWLWVAYLQPTWISRLAWLVAILLLGNIAMALYVLIRLFRLPRNASWEQLLLRKSAQT